MKVKLTDISVQKLRAPDGKQLIVWDATPGYPGFALCLNKGGSKTWLLIQGKDRKKTTLGSYPAVPLGKAREAVRNILAKQTLAGRETATAESLKPTITYDDAFEQYDAAHLSTLRSQKDIRGAIKHDAHPILCGKLLHNITDEDVSKVLNRIRVRGAEYQRTNTRAFLRKFFSWCMKVDNLGADRLKANPAAETSKSHPDCRATTNNAGPKKTNEGVVHSTITGGLREERF